MHQPHIQLEHLDKSAVAEHNVNQKARIQFHNTSILTITTRYMDRIIREDTETELHLYNMHKQAGFCLSKS
jgi:hypothetical protein